jgi:integrase
LDGYEGLLRSRIVPALGDFHLNRIDAAVVDAWIGSMVDEGLSPSRIRQAHQTLGAMMKLAVRRGMISSNACDGTTLPTQQQREQRFLTAEELAALATAMPEHLAAATWTLGVGGLRFGEMAALERPDVDVLRRRIDVSKSVTEINGRLFVGETKNRKTRSVAVPQILAVIINDHLTRHDSGVAFPDTKGGRLRVSNFRGRVLKACGAAGLEPIRTHDLRHTAAGLMLAVEPDLYLVMRQLGHSSIAVTVDCYGHLLPGRADQVADKLDAMLTETLEPAETVVEIRRPQT